MTGFYSEYRDPLDGFEEMTGIILFVINVQSGCCSELRLKWSEDKTGSKEID